MRFATCFIAIFWALAPLGCRSAPDQPGFADVQKLTADRLGQTIRWNQHSADDRSVAASVRQMLSGELSADQADQIALLNNRSLQASYARLGIAQADLVQAGLLKNPVFDASVRFPNHSPSGPNVELSITQSFLDLLLIPVRKKVAAAEFEKVKLDVSRAVVDLAEDVRAAHYTLTGAEQLLALRESAAQTLALASQTAQAMHDAGTLNELDLATHQAANTEAQIEADAARAEVQEDRQRIAVLMGLDGSNVDFKVLKQLPDPTDDANVEQLLALAQSQRLDLLAARQATEVILRTANATRASAIIPSFDIGADTERDPGGQRVTGPVFSLPIPLFDQGQASVARVRAELVQSREQYRALAIQINADVRRCSVKVAALHVRLDRYRTELLPLRQTIVDQSQLHYNGMLLDVLQLLRVRQEQIDAKRDYIATLRDYWVAHVELERAVGGHLPAAKSGP